MTGFPSAEAVTRLLEAVEMFDQRVKLVPLPKEIDRKDLRRPGLARLQYLEGKKFPGRGLDSEAIGMAALLYAFAGAVAEAVELLDDALPPDQDWRGGFLKAREMQAEMRAALWPIRQTVPDA